MVTQAPLRKLGWRMTPCALCSLHPTTMEKEHAMNNWKEEATPQGERIKSPLALARWLSNKGTCCVILET